MYILIPVVIITLIGLSFGVNAMVDGRLSIPTWLCVTTPVVGLVIMILQMIFVPERSKGNLEGVYWGDYTEDLPDATYKQTGPSTIVLSACGRHFQISHMIRRSDGEKYMSVYEVDGSGKYISKETTCFAHPSFGESYSMSAARLIKKTVNKKQPLTWW